MLSSIHINKVIISGPGKWILNYRCGFQKLLHPVCLEGVEAGLTDEQTPKCSSQGQKF